MYTHDGYRNGAVMSTRDYQVVDIQTNSEKSVGKVASSTGNLIWEEGKTHDFYSVYPGNYIGSNDINGNDRVISLTLPSAQQGDIAANMRYAYMAAVHEGYSTEGRGSVVLDYYPMVTTIYITLNNATQEPITIKSVRLKSTDGAALVGTYKIRSSGGTSPFAPQTYNFVATSTEVSVVLGSASLQPGESTTCVIFLMPVRTYSPSAMQLSVVTGAGVSDLSLANSTNIQFEPCKKYNLAFNVEEREIKSSDLTVGMCNLCILSNSAISENFEFLSWKNPPGLYYKQSYRQGSWPDYPDGYIPVSQEDLQNALLQVTEISNLDGASFSGNVADITPADFTIFPNLRAIKLTNMGTNNSFSVANLSNMLDLMYSGNASSLSINNCNFNANDASPLVIKSTRWLSNITLTDITGLKDLVLQAGDETNPHGNGGNIGEVFIQNCPDLQTIKIISAGGQVSLEKAVFDNLGVETIYIEQANNTNEIEIKDCYNLERFIVSNQSNDDLNNISLSNCPILGNSVEDNSEYGLTGFNVEWVSTSFTARKYNCPNLGPTFNTKNNNGPVTITFRE